MKKTLSFISVLILVTGVFVSCGDKGIVGTWTCNADAIDIIEKTKADGVKVENAELVFTKSDVICKEYLDISDVYCLTEDQFLIYGEKYDIEYDGKRLKAFKDDCANVYKWERIGAPDKVNVYGKYKLVNDFDDEDIDNENDNKHIYNFAENGDSHLFISDKTEYNYNKKSGSGRIFPVCVDGEEEELSLEIDDDIMTVSYYDTVLTFTRAE